jgi:hypothetical protein
MVARKQLRTKSRKSRTTRRTRKHRGGAYGNTGYTFNQSDAMGGQMARVGYSHCDTPEYFNKFQVYDVPEMVSTATPVPQIGGKRKKSKRTSEKRTKRTMKSKKTRKHSSRK